MNERGVFGGVRKARREADKRGRDHGFDGVLH
jgi:hypothetical protein